jgi:hypothetical protein
MKKLPQELVSQICSYLSTNDLYGVFFLPTTFRAEAEDHAQKLPGDIQYNERDKHTFISLYRGFRHRLLTKITLKPYVPDPPDGDEEYYCNGVTADEQRDRDVIFTAQVRDMFDMLKSMENRTREHNQDPTGSRYLFPMMKIMPICASVPTMPNGTLAC